ncbi:MAG: LysR substrate-binding domain-containing protein [Verrucomicrobium sp.]|nr:LysR substrate-binding domain-containing protein [Verrucomicrobium sp.]
MERIQTRELEYFLAVAEELSFVKAARRLHLSQPPLSRHIQILEGKLGTSLLKRDTRNVSLTPEGALFAEQAREILQQMDRAVESVSRARKGQVDRLRIGFVGALLEEKMPNLLRRFHQSHPECQLQLFEMDAAQQLEALQEKKIDGAFIGTAPARLPAKLDMIPWKTAPLYIVLAGDHPLAKRREITLESVAHEPWIVLAASSAPAFHSYFLDLCSKSGFRPRITTEVRRYPEAMAMVAVGEGVCLAADTVLRLAPRDVVFRPLKPARTLNHVFVFHKNERPPMLDGLIAELRAAKAGDYSGRTNPKRSTRSAA